MFVTADWVGRWGRTRDEAPKFTGRGAGTAPGESNAFPKRGATM